MGDVQVPEMMTFCPVTEQDIIAVVMNLKDAGAGLDGINAKLLKLILPAILSQLKHLLNTRTGGGGGQKMPSPPVFHE